MNKGFTLVEVIISLAIIAVLSAVVMLGVSQYINVGKDSNIAGELSSLIPGGEIFYTGNSNSYNSFCDASNGLLAKVVSQMPDNLNGVCYAGSAPSSGNISGNPKGVCCAVNSPLGNAWVAYARNFANPLKIHCVDSRGANEDTDGGVTNIAAINYAYRCLP